MKKSGTMRKLMALILSVVVVITMMPQICSPSKVSADETANSQPNYLTFTAAEADSSVTLNWKSADEVQIKRSTDADWSDYEEGTKIELSNIGDSVSFRGKNVITDSINHFAMEGKIKASGSVTSLTDEMGSNPDVQLTANRYMGMFVGCKSLETAPELPATSLANSCYESMFNGCKSLEIAPKLPAMTLAKDCYRDMFSNCTSLKTAPKLPATTLADSCYRYMFASCTSIQTAPELPATALADYCYYSMFNGCTSLKTASELPATTLAENCYYSMFYGCTSLETAPELPAEIVANSCYSRMFFKCTSLKKAPELPAKELASECYKEMFRECTSLKTAPKLPATSLAWRCYAYMFYYCSELNINTISNEAHSLPWVIANTGTGSDINSEIYMMFTGAWNVDFGNGYGQSAPKAGTVYYTGCDHDYGSDNKCKICGWEKPATEINTVDITISAPIPNDSFNTSATCSTTGVASASSITWTKADDTAVSENEKAQYGTEYYANITLTAADGYVFTNTTAVKCNSKSYDGTAVTLNDDGTLTVKIPFTTAKAKLLGITKPQQNVNVGFGAAKTAEGLGLPETVAVETELSEVTSADIEWNLDDVNYDKTKYEE